VNRRGFLKHLGIAAAATSAGMIALLEQELRKPPCKIFLPPKHGWLSDGQLNVGDVVHIEGKEGLWIIGERTVELWTWIPESWQFAA
jgi:hypothetical protein